MNNLYNPKHPVVLFIPEAGIYPYVRGLAVLGDAIQRKGGKVLITHDTGQMLRSPIMAMYKTSVNVNEKEKLKIRKVTEKYIKNVLEEYKFSTIELSELTSKVLLEEIDNLGNGIKDIKKICFRGFPVGKMAEFDFILETKFPYSLKLSDLHRELYLRYIKNTALAIALTDEICEKYKPSLLITFNEYAQCQAVKYSALKHKIKFKALTYPVHFNIDASRFSLWESTYRRWITEHCQGWEKWKNIPINKSDVVASWADSIFRMYGQGSHIFSTKKKDDPAIVFKSLNLNSKRKTIIVYTSSQEERSCAGIAMKIWGENENAVDVFSNQIEWLKMLRSYAEKREDIQIVVRIHPREGSRQHGFDSKHLQLLKRIFKLNTSKFIIVWPDDPVSSYDLMELADVCLISWSLMGQEAARVGIPVLSCVSKMFYPDDDFIQVAHTLKMYEKKLNKILEMDYIWQHLVKAIRFYHWRTFIPSLDLGEAVPRAFDNDTMWPKISSSNVEIINNVLSDKEDLIKGNIKRWKNSLPKEAVFQENVAIKYGIRFFLDGIFCPPKIPIFLNKILLAMNYVWYVLFKRRIIFEWPKKIFRDYELKCSNDYLCIDNFVKETRMKSRLRIVVTHGSEAIYICKGKVISRMSPMAVKLINLYGSN